MTVVNPKSISGITSITTASGSDNLLTIHTSDANNTERLRIDSTGTTKIVTGIVTTLTATGSAKVGSGITLSPDGNIFATGITTLGVSGSNNPNADGGQIVLGGTVSQLQLFTGSQVGLTTFIFGNSQVGSAITDMARFDLSNKTNGGLSISMDDDSNLSYIRHRDNGGNMGIILRHGSQNRERVRIMSSGRVGIGSTIPTTDLDVNGFIKSGAPSFSAKVSGTQSLSTGSEVAIIFNSEDHDTDNAYNVSTGEFTVPSGKGGKYFIAVNFGIDDTGEVGDILRLRVFKNGSLLPGFRGQNVQAQGNYILTTSVSGTVTLAAGDVIKCMAYTDSDVGDALIEVDCTYFSMFRIAI